MSFCGLCEFFGSCVDVYDTSLACSNFYPDVYMEVSHPEYWEEYRQELVKRHKRRDEKKDNFCNKKVEEE